MLENLLPIAVKNSKFFDQFKIFDIGKVWTKAKEAGNQALDERYAEQHFCEELQLGACRYEKSITSRSEDPLLKVKAIAMKLIKKLGIKGKLSFEKSDF